MRIYSSKYYENRSNANKRNRLRYFCRKNMTIKQAYELFSVIDDDQELFIRLCQAYTDYKVCCGRGYLSLITNLDALFKSPEAEERFIDEIKTYILDTLGIPREEVEDGKNRDNRAEENNT